MVMRILTILLLLSFSCSHPESDIPDSSSKISTRSVTVIPARKIIYNEKGEAFGEVLPAQKLRISPRIVGKIMERRVEVGDHVKRNQVLFRMIQDIPGMKFEPEEITAPIEGDVTRVMVEEGSRVSPQSPLLEMINRERVYFQMFVIPGEYEIVKKAGSFEVTLDLHLGKIYEAVPDKIYPEADPKTGMIAIRLLLRTHSTIPAGTRGKVTYVRKKVTGFLIPVDAISVEGIHTYIWTVKKGKAHRKKIFPLAYEGKNAICQGDLMEGDTIVFAGWNMLNENDPVKISEKSVQTE